MADHNTYGSPPVFSRQAPRYPSQQPIRKNFATPPTAFTREPYGSPPEPSYDGYPYPSYGFKEPSPEEFFQEDFLSRSAHQARDFYRPAYSFEGRPFTRPHGPTPPRGRSPGNRRGSPSPPRCSPTPAILSHPSSPAYGLSGPSSYDTPPRYHSAGGTPPPSSWMGPASLSGPLERVPPPPGWWGRGVWSADWAGELPERLAIDLPSLADLDNWGDSDEEEDWGEGRSEKEERRAARATAPASFSATEVKPKSPPEARIRRAHVCDWECVPSVEGREEFELFDIRAAQALAAIRVLQEEKGETSDRILALRAAMRLLFVKLPKPPVPSAPAKEPGS